MIEFKAEENRNILDFGATRSAGKRALEHGGIKAFDYNLAFYCAPTLAGIKPANLISIQREDWDAMKDGIARSGRAFVGRQIYFRRLAYCAKGVRLLVYRRDLLAAFLAMPQNRSILERYGYEQGMTVAAMLNRLTIRMEQSDAFPHEIGVFLGYPPEDVLGFIEHGGKHYCLCGCWKVYGNPVEAKRLFCAYERIRCFFCERVRCGEEIQTIQYGGIA